jgi:hypothetical protein
MTVNGAAGNSFKIIPEARIKRRVFYQLCGAPNDKSRIIDTELGIFISL